MHIIVGIESQFLCGCWQEALVHCPAGFLSDCLNVLRSCQLTFPRVEQTKGEWARESTVPGTIQSPKLTLFLSNHNLMGSFNLRTEINTFFTIMKSTFCKSFQIALDALFPTICSLIHYSITQSQTHQLPILDVIVLQSSIILKINHFTNSFELMQRANAGHNF